jgi:hypothetical protein
MRNPLGSEESQKNGFFRKMDLTEKWIFQKKWICQKNGFARKMDLSEKCATTISITTFSITTCFIMAFSITKLSIMTLSITTRKCANAD